MLKCLSALLLTTALLAVPSDAAPTENLIGEELVTASTASSFANRVIAEAKRIWASGSNSGWTMLSDDNNILNEGKAISGVFAAAGVNVTRATGTVDVQAQRLFDYLITAEGYQLIDPFSKPEDFAKPPLESFPTSTWRGAGSTGKRLEVARTESAIPGIRPREFVVFNVVDASTRIFVSKSVQHEGDPGCSLYGGETCYDPTAVPVRALNTFAVQIQPLKSDPDRCVVQLLNYADLMRPEIPVEVQNAINGGFLPQVLGRMQAAFP